MWRRTLLESAHYTCRPAGEIKVSAASRSLRGPAARGAKLSARSYSARGGRALEGWERRSNPGARAGKTPRSWKAVIRHPNGRRLRRLEPFGEISPDQDAAERHHACQ